MSKISSAVSTAMAWANDSSHGYDQSSRWGPDYDCSSFLISVWESVGVPVKSNGATYTGNMRSVFLGCGFTDVSGSVDTATGAGLQEGDVLLNQQHHTAMFVGNGQMVEAYLNESGGINGGRTGDQTGQEIRVTAYRNYSKGWDAVLRYMGEDEDEVPQFYTIQKGDTLQGICQRFFGNAMLYREVAEMNGILDPNRIWAGQKIRLYDDGCLSCMLPETDGNHIAEVSKKVSDCRYNLDGICTNADCPARADYCPVMGEYEEICKYREVSL